MKKEIFSGDDEVRMGVNKAETAADSRSIAQ